MLGRSHVAVHCACFLASELLKIHIIKEILYRGAFKAGQGLFDTK